MWGGVSHVGPCHSYMWGGVSQLWLPTKASSSSTKDFLFDLVPDQSHWAIYFQFTKRAVLLQVSEPLGLCLPPIERGILCREPIDTVILRRAPSDRGMTFREVTRHFMIDHEMP